jgi:hypothetical protein
MPSQHFFDSSHRCRCLCLGLLLEAEVSILFAERPLVLSIAVIFELLTSEPLRLKMQQVQRSEVVCKHCKEACWLLDNPCEDTGT